MVPGAPDFFDWHAGSVPGAAWASSIHSPVSLERRWDGGMDVRLLFDDGRFWAEIMKGTRWTDVVGHGSPEPVPFMVSERVALSLKKARIERFDAWPVEVRKIHSKRLRETARPRYYCLVVGGRLDVDVGDGPRSRGRILPRRETWDATDLCRCPERPRMVFCTLKVLELAREHRWTNCRFDLLGADPLRARTRGGIDYLGKRWPPKDWHPPVPGARKRANLLRRLVETENRGERWKAQHELSRLGEEGLELVVPAYEAATGDARHRLAWLLKVLLSHGVTLPDKIERSERRETKRRRW
jgi:hypothetical protein